MIIYKMIVLIFTSVINFRSDYNFIFLSLLSEHICIMLLVCLKGLIKVLFIFYMARARNVILFIHLHPVDGLAVYFWHYVVCVCVCVCIETEKVCRFAFVEVADVVCRFAFVEVQFCLHCPALIFSHVYITKHKG